MRRQAKRRSQATGRKAARPRATAAARRAEHERRRDRLLQAIALWMRSRHFRTDLETSDVETTKDAKTIADAFEKAAAAMGLLLPVGAISMQDADAADIFDFMVNARELAELVGVRIEATRCNAMLLVLFADELDVAACLEHFEVCHVFAAWLTEIGAFRVWGTAQTPAWAYPLLIFRDSAAYAQKVPALYPAGYRKARIGTLGFVQAGFLDLESATVEWTPPKGAWLRGLMPRSWRAEPPLQQEDLETILTLLEQAQEGD